MDDIIEFRKHLLVDMKDNLPDLSNFIEGQQYLIDEMSIEAITLEYLLGKGTEALIESFRGIGIFLTSNDLWIDNYLEIQKAVNLYRYLKPDNLVKIIPLIKESTYLIEIEEEASSLYLSEFLLLCYEAVKSPDVLELHNFVSEYLTNSSQFITYIKNIIKLSIDFSALIDNIDKWILYVISIKSKMTLAIEQHSNSCEYLIKGYEKWCYEFSRIKDYNLLYGYLKEDKDYLKDMVIDIYKKFKITTPGYQEYYIYKKIISDDELIEFIAEHDPLAKVLI